MSLTIKTLSLLTRRIPLTSFAESRNIKRWVSPTLKTLYVRRKKIGPEPETPRSSFMEWNYEAEIFAFGKRLGEEFDKKLLKQALVQREYANLKQIEAEKESGESVEKLEDNHEMIREGEEIIQNYIRGVYSKVYSDDVVDGICQYLTSESSLAHVGKHIGLKDIVLTNEFPVVEKTLSDTLKAVIAALKQSKDLKTAENFMKDFIVVQMHNKDIYDIWQPKNPYDYLAKLLKEKGVKDFEPRLCNQSGTNTILACFQIGLYSNKKLLGIGWGESIEIAKNTAALDAIQRIQQKNVLK